MFSPKSGQKETAQTKTAWNKPRALMITTPGLPACFHFRRKQHLEYFCQRNKGHIFTIILSSKWHKHSLWLPLFHSKQHWFVLPALGSVFPFTFPSLHSPVGSTFLLTVRLTCPFRAALCIRSITYRWVLPATGIPSTYTSSSPGWRRPSLSAEPMAITAPMRI